MNSIKTYLNLAVTLGLSVLAALYSSVYLLSFILPNEKNEIYSVQIIHMLEINGTIAGMLVQASYTILMVLTAVLAVKNSRQASKNSQFSLIVASFFILLITSLALVYAYFINWQPAKFEYYIFEGLTALTAALCIYLNKEPRVENSTDIITSSS